MRAIDADAINYRVVEYKDELYAVIQEEEIEEMPTLDVVPVIRCKDCKFHYDRTRCEKRIGSWFYEDYCNGAVRMDADDFEH